MSCKESNGNDKLPSQEAKGDDLVELGKMYARGWLKKPPGKPLLLPLNCHEIILDAVKHGLEMKRAGSNDAGFFQAAAILDILGIYNATIDEVLGHFIVLSQMAPTRAPQ